MDNYRFNWFFVFSIICLSIADKHYGDTPDPVYRRQSASRLRIPKFEFYIYNNVGTMVRQYLTVREIQQLLLQQSLRLGPPSLGSLKSISELSFCRNESDWFVTGEKFHLVDYTTASGDRNPSHRDSNSSARDPRPEQC